MRSRPASDESGFGLAELLVASVLTAVVIGFLLFELRDLSRTWRVAGEHVDVTARTRAGADVIASALRRAGAGFWLSADSTGRAAAFPAVFPSRFAVSSSDPEMAAFADRFTAVSSGDDRPRLALVTTMGDASDPLMVVPLPGCPSSSATCGLEPGQMALIFDQQGHADLFRVTWTSGQWIGHDPPTLSHAYASSEPTRVVGVELRAFHHLDLAARLNEYRGKSAAMPMLDHVADMSVAYLGEPDPLKLPRPPLGVDTCLFAPDGLPKLSTLTATAGPWAVLTPGSLADGPTCGQAPFRFDADLFRVRAVRLELRVEAASALARGVESATFWNPGSATHRAQWVADQLVTVDVALRAWGGA